MGLGGTAMLKKWSRIGILKVWQSESRSIICVWKTRDINGSNGLGNSMDEVNRLMYDRAEWSVLGMEGVKETRKQM